MLRASAAALGVHQVRDLGYADSGHGPILSPDPPDRPGFGRADLHEAAARLGGMIREEHADVLLSYDSQGGYGHSDRVKVHQVGALAAEMTGTRILEVALRRDLVAVVSDPARLPGLTLRYDLRVVRSSYSPPSAITHRANCGRASIGSFDLPFGRVAVVAAPFGNTLVLRDLPEGHHCTVGKGKQPERSS
jgi:LmbE family N-acetylglucosaminyl deacetylase